MKQHSLFLDDYLNRPDFAESLVDLAGDLVAKAHLPARVDEIGLVCSNVLLAAQYLEKNYKGMNFFFLGSGSPVMFNENGIETPFTTRLGFGFYKGVILELAEPGIGSQVFAQTKVIDHKIMINHLGFRARDMALTRTEYGKTISYAEVMASIGVKKIIEAELNVFGFIGHIHIFETMHLTHGVEVEFLDFRFGSLKGIKMGYPAGLMHLAGWFQEKIGPRFFNMKADQSLPPAPVE